MCLELIFSIKKVSNSIRLLGVFKDSIESLKYYSVAEAMSYSSLEIILLP